MDEKLCKGCINECAGVCPVEVPSEYDFGIGKRKAIYVPYPQAVPLVACVDPKACIGCARCVEACPAQAVKLDQEPQDFKLNVGAIIVATGWQPFDATRKEEYGFGRYRDVITTLQMERMLNASGPTKGEVVRPSTGKIARVNSLPAVRRLARLNGRKPLLLSHLLHGLAQECATGQGKVS